MSVMNFFCKKCKNFFRASKNEKMKKNEKHEIEVNTFFFPCPLRSNIFVFTKAKRHFYNKNFSTICFRFLTSARTTWKKKREKKKRKDVKKRKEKEEKEENEEHEIAKRWSTSESENWKIVEICISRVNNTLILSHTHNCRSSTR